MQPVVCESSILSTISSLLITGLATTPTRPQSQGQVNQRRGNGYDPSRERHTNTNPKGLVSQRPKNANWAVPAALVTTRKEIRNNENALKEAEFQRLRSIPERNDEFAVTVSLLTLILRVRN